MKRIINATLLCLLAACAGADDEGVVVPGFEEGLGQLEQPVFRPFKYGIEGVNDAQHHPDFGLMCEGTLPAEVADNWCSVPDSKTLKFNWSPSTCNAEWQGILFQAITDWQTDIGSVGWTISGTGDFNLSCGALSGSTTLGKFTSGPSWDQIGTSYGTLGQYRNGNIKIDTADSDAFCSFAVTEPSNDNCKYNLARHELFHLVGLGHNNNGTGPDLMSQRPDGTWVTKKSIGSTRLDMLDCYNPANGGLFDDC